MKKKIATLAMAAVMTFSITAMADYNAVSQNGKLIIPVNESEGTNVLLAGYDANNKLVGAQFLTADNGNYTAEAYQNAVSYRIGALNVDNFSDLKITAATDAPSTPAPSTTTTPTTEPEETDDPSATEVPKNYPSIYDQQKDAVFTFAVVKKVSSTQDSDGEDAYSVDVLIRGEETTLTVPESAQIIVASDAYSSMVGSNAGVLKEGDIVYFDTSLRGKITQMAFMYRPVKENIITSATDYGTNFEKLFSSAGRVYGSQASDPGVVIPFSGSTSSSRYQYAFGVITSKDSSGFTLYNKSGKSDNSIDVNIQNDTIVYVCDMSNKGEVSLGKIGSITKSPIPSSAFDDNDNVTFTDDYSYNYAFARVVNGTATEVVVFTNYND